MTTWKPGDLLTDHAGARLFKIEVSANTRTAWRSGACLVSPDGNGRKEEYHPGIRPLVVIDPESAEDVKRLSDELDKALRRLYPETYGNAPELDSLDDIALTQAALREFANPTPPKPPVLDYDLTPAVLRAVECGEPVSIGGRVYVLGPDVTQ